MDQVTELISLSNTRFIPLTWPNEFQSEVTRLFWRLTSASESGEGSKKDRNTTIVILSVDIFFVRRLFPLDRKISVFGVFGFASVQQKAACEINFILRVVSPDMQVWNILETQLCPLFQKRENLGKTTVNSGNDFLAKVRNIHRS